MNKLIPIIILILFFMSSDAFSVERIMTNKIRIERGEKKIYEINEGDIAVIKNIINNGDIELKIMSSVSSLVVDNLIGNGSLTISSSEKCSIKSIELKEVEQQALNISKNIKGEMLIGRKVKIGTFKYNGASIKRIIFDKDVIFSEMQMNVNEDIDEFVLHDCYIDNINILGVKRGLRSRVNTIDITLQSNINRDNGFNISVNNVRISSLKIKNEPLPEIYSDITINIFNLRDLESLFIDLESCKLNTLNIQELVFKNNTNPEVTIDLGKIKGNGVVVFSDFFGKPELSLDVNGFIRSLMMKKVTFSGIEMDLKEYSSLKHIDISAFWVTEYIKSPKKQLLYIAKNNMSESFHFKKKLYKIISKKGFFRNANKTIERPGLSALQASIIDEINQLSIEKRIFGWLLFIITGYGTTLVFPFIFYCLIILIFVFKYLQIIGLKDCKNHILKLLAMSILSTFRLGHLVLSKYYNDIKEKEDLKKMMSVQFAVFAAQATICSIFFGQTLIV